MKTLSKEALKDINGGAKDGYVDKLVNKAWDIGGRAASEYTNAQQQITNTRNGKSLTHGQ